VTLVAEPTLAKDKVLFGVRHLWCPPWHHSLQFPSPFEFDPDPAAEEEVAFVRFVIPVDGDGEHAEGSPFYVGIANRFHALPSPPIRLLVGSYTLQLICPNGRRLSGVLTLEAEGLRHPVATVSAIPILENLDMRTIEAILRHNREDPILLTTEVRGRPGKEGVRVASLCLGSRQGLEALTAGFPQSLELYLSQPVHASIARLADDGKTWVDCPSRFEVPVLPQMRYLRVSIPTGDAKGGAERAHVYMAIAPGPITELPSAGVTAAEIRLSDTDIEEILDGSVKRIIEEYNPPEYGGSKAVSLFEAVVGNRSPAKALTIPQ
jgi:hypothetical protein